MQLLPVGRQGWRYPRPGAHYLCGQRGRLQRFWCSDTGSRHGYKAKLEKWDSDSDSDETDEEDLKV